MIVTTSEGRKTRPGVRNRREGNSLLWLGSSLFHRSLRSLRSVGMTLLWAARAAQPHSGRGTPDRRELALGEPKDRERVAAIEDRGGRADGTSRRAVGSGIGNGSVIGKGNGHGIGMIVGPKGDV